MHTDKKRMTSVRSLAELSVLAALVILLQLFGGGLRIGAIPVSLVLIPIAVGGVMLGPSAGTILGFLFGGITLIMGVTGADIFTHTLFEAQPWMTALVCLVKGTLAGLCGGLVYRALEGKQKTVATLLASCTVPVVNTGLFCLGATTVLRPSLVSFASDPGFGGAEGMTVVYYVLIVCAGINFIAEFAVNLIASAAIDRLRAAMKWR